VTTGGSELETDELGIDAGGVLLGSAAGVSPGVELEGVWPSVRNLLRMLEASLGVIVVVVVVLRALANTVTVTVSGVGSSLGLPDRNGVVVEDVLDDVVVVELLEPAGLPSVELSEPVMPPVPPAAVIRPRAVLSLVQSRAAPGALRLGMAKHC
jgi:hypothetical protein